MALREILAVLGVEVEDKQLREFDKLLEGVTGNLKKFAGAVGIGAGMKALTSFIGGQVEAAFQLRRTADMLGVTTDELQSWRHVANIAGESTEKFDTAMRFMLKNVGSAEVGLTAAGKEMARWGVQVKDAHGKGKPLGDLLGEFSDKLVAMPDQAQRTRAAIAIFGRSGAQILPFLLQGSKAIKAQLEDFHLLGGGMSHEFVEAAGKAATQFRRVKLAVVGLTSGLIGPLLPTIERLARGLAHAAAVAADYAKNTNAVKVALWGMSAALTGGLLLRLNKLVNLGKLMTVSWADVGKMLVAYAPIVLIVGALAALFLIVEDIVTAIEGGESVVRRLLDELVGTEEADAKLRELRDAWEKMGEAFKTAYDVMKPALKELGVLFLETFEAGLPLAVDAISASVIALSGTVRLLVGGMLALGKAAKGAWTWAQASSVDEDALLERGVSPEKIAEMKKINEGKKEEASRLFEEAGQIIDKVGNATVSPTSPFAKMLGTVALGTKFDASGQAIVPQGEARVPFRQGLEYRGDLATGPYRGGEGYGSAGGGGRNVSSHVEANIVIQGSASPKETADEVTFRLSGLSREAADALNAVAP